MDFAPYQSSPPESTRALSPPIPSSKQQQYIPPAATSRASYEDPWAASRNTALPSPSAFIDNSRDNYYDDDNDDIEAIQQQPQQQQQRNARSWGRASNDGAYVFETSLKIRMDVEAALAYLLLPPVGGVALLIFEQKSDYVRFHAWQSCLAFSAIFVVHLIFSWSSAISWILFVADIGLILWLVFRAYRDAEALD
ncbi:hypothetical protein AAFC00_001566, partial [Neodothiora populina]